MVCGFVATSILLAAFRPSARKLVLLDVPIRRGSRAPGTR
jgi:hypothetical protein